MNPHSWIPVGSFRALCRHCGTERTVIPQSSGPDVVYRFPDDEGVERHLLRRAPPCRGSWPKNWRPIGTDLVEAEREEFGA